MKSRILPIAALLVLLLMLIALINYRYHQLKTRVDITQYFTHATYILSFLRKNDFGKELSPVPEPVKFMPGNLLPVVGRYVPPLAKYPFYDPFPSNNNPKPVLELRYGQAQHVISAASMVLNSTNTFWLMWSAGPSRIPPEIQIQPGAAAYPLYRYGSPPYDATNGLWSRGYLYMDSMGGIFGKIKG